MISQFCLLWLPVCEKEPANNTCIFVRQEAFHSASIVRINKNIPGRVKPFLAYFNFAISKSITDELTKTGGNIWSVNFYDLFNQIIISLIILLEK